MALKNGFYTLNTHSNKMLQIHLPLYRYIHWGPLYVHPQAWNHTDYFINSVGDYHEVKPDELPDWVRHFIAKEKLFM